MRYDYSVDRAFTTPVSVIWTTNQKVLYSSQLDLPELTAEDAFTTSGSLSYRDGPFEYNRSIIVFPSCPYTRQFDPLLLILHSTRSGKLTPWSRRGEWKGKTW